MSNIVQFPSAPAAPKPATALPYSFDIVQSSGGLVSIDACVPMAVALAMLEMLKALPTATA
jgi:hypothetical protein